MLGVAGDRDACVLRAGDLHGGVLGQLGDDGIGVGVGPAVQLLHDFGNAEVGYLRVDRIVHRSHPIILLR